MAPAADGGSSRGSGGRVLQREVRFDERSRAVGRQRVEETAGDGAVVVEVPEALTARRVEVRDRCCRHRIGFELRALRVEPISVVPGQDGDIARHGLLVGHALRFVLAEEQQGAGPQECGRVCLMVVLAIADHFGLETPSGEILEHGLDEPGFEHVPVPAHLVVDEDVDILGQRGRILPAVRIDSGGHMPHLSP